MIKRTLRIGHWVADFLFCEDRYDIDGVVACLYDAFAPQRIIDKAVNLMRSCEYDCGFTYSNPVHRRAVVLIGPTTSASEFLNSFSHEVRHLADAIALSIGVDLHSETPAYLTGDAVMALAEVVCRFGCEHCRKKG